MSNITVMFDTRTYEVLQSRYLMQSKACCPLQAGTEETCILHSNERCFGCQQSDPKTHLVLHPRSNGEQIEFDW